MTMVLVEPQVESVTSGLATSPAVSRERQTPLGERSEIEVIRLAQRGDAAAFGDLYKSHCRRIYALCLRMTGNPALAEDLTQDVFLQVFRKIQTFRAESAFSTWLYRWAVNIVLMRRRIKTLKETSLDEGSETEGDSPRPREIGRTDQHLIGVVDRVNLNRALRQLPRGYRQMFVLHDMMGYEHHEIAEAMGC